MRRVPGRVDRKPKNEVSRGELQAKPERCVGDGANGKPTTAVGSTGLVAGRVSEQERRRLPAERAALCVSERVRRMRHLRVETRPKETVLQQAHPMNPN